MASRLRITQVRSAIRQTGRQKRTLEALGLRRMHQTVEHNDTPQIRGMLGRVSHLVTFEVATGAHVVDREAPAIASPKGAGDVGTTSDASELAGEAGAARAASEKSATRKTSKRKATADEAAVKETAARQTATKKTPTRKTTAGKSATKKTAAKKTTAKKSASKKSTSGKTATKKAATRKSSRGDKADSGK